MSENRRGQFRIFVGNTQQVSYSDIREKFSEFGKVAEVDLKGSYGFVGFDTEEAALLAVEKMDNSEFKGRQLNVEMSLGKPRSGGNNHGGNNRDRDGPRNFDRDRNKEGTVKLHVAGVGMNPDTEKIKQIFEEYGKVSEVHSIPNRDIVFVHIDEKAPELAMIGLNGKDYEGRKLKIEYGTLQDKPNYDKRAPKAKLHVANLPDCSLDQSEILRKKFDLYGSVEEAEMIKSKHIAFIRIDERYAQRAINAINNSYFFGKTIKVQFSKHNQGQDRHQGPGMMGNLPMGLGGVNDFGVPPPPMGRPLGPPPRFCYDDFSQLSGQRPNVRLVRSGDIDSLIIRRKRLETIHPYERQLLSYPAETRDLPPPPPEFLRLIRDRAEIKSQILLHQAEIDGKLTLLAKDDDEYGFSGASRSRSPIVPYSSRGREPGLTSGYDSRSSYRSSPPKSRYANAEGGYNSGQGINYGGNSSFESRY